MANLIVAALVIKSLVPLHTLPIDAGSFIPSYGYARDTQFEYLATPNGLYRSPRLATTIPEPIAFAGEVVHAVDVHEGAVYVAKEGEHTLFRDFQPIDANLLDCTLTPCSRLVPTHIELEGNRLYVNAGGNVLATDDGGASWHQLYGLPSSDGKPTTQICPVEFTVSGARLLIGGECPLDVAWLHRGTLDNNGLQWSQTPRAVIAPELENRNVQFIRDLGDGVVYAGIEGALLKSTDGGTTFRFVIHYPLSEADRYPYVGHMVVARGVMIVGGFDKKNDAGYLAYSNDGRCAGSERSYGNPRSRRVLSAGRKKLADR